MANVYYKEPLYSFNKSFFAHGDAEWNVSEMCLNMGLFDEICLTNIREILLVKN